MLTSPSRAAAAAVALLALAAAGGICRMPQPVNGPTIVMRDPSMPVPDTSPFTNPEAIVSMRILWSEPVTLSPSSDIRVTRQSDGSNVGFSAYGGGSAIIGITFFAPLLNDTYIVFIRDTVRSVATGQPIDGNNDGFAGGDAYIFMRHASCDIAPACPSDWDGNGVVNSTDVSDFINAWFEDIAKGCGL